GVSAVELWYTRDGKRWQKDPAAGRGAPPFVAEVEGEGTYGFTLVAKNGLGVGQDPPKSGDLPQVWVEVDLTRPAVKLEEVKHGQGDKARGGTIRWTGKGRNLGGRAIPLSHAEGAGGPGTTVAANLENSGRYVWAMPDKAPARFFVRVEAADLAGNVG